MILKRENNNFFNEQIQIKNKGKSHLAFLQCSTLTLHDKIRLNVTTNFNLKKKS